ncbi:retrovirus-related Pol polyprotein from transposon 297 [Saimiri boliviensis]|uniref:retrovirus-related Pol polyprotein from transposon 297 n=1 Tax=Saimiri boliviensis TaxID=27679 RepID=UPI003D777340
MPNSNKVKGFYLFSLRKTVPLRPEARKGLQDIVRDLKAQGLVKSCNSPYNTPVLGVQKPNGQWRLVQDLRLINEAVIPLYSAVPNPYTLLSQIPRKAQLFTVLDLKVTFFCVPLHPDSQFLFAFEDPLDQSSQLSWTASPQGFRNSPHLFSQALAQDLSSFSHPGPQVLQYLDNLLLAESSESQCQHATQDLLNVLANCGYKVSKPKAQLCRQEVKYLGLVLSKGTWALDKGHLQTMLDFPHPKTLKQLQGILGITGFCRLWIPRYGEIGKPLYTLIKETPKANTHLVLWDPIVEVVFQTLKQALLQAPALSLPTGNDFSLYVTEKSQVALGVLTQTQGATPQPVAYLSKKINAVAKGWPHCL